MEVTRFIVNMIEENCYLVYDETGEAALIDCGAFYDEEKKAIRQFLESHNLRLVRMFNTHAHFDHLFGAHYIYKEYGVKMEIAAAERETYESAVQQMQQFMHRALPLELPPVCNYFADGDELKVGNFTLQVIATPGHTPGGVCLYAKEAKLLFSGDSLFRHEIGRCDLPRGSEVQLINALRTRILALPDEVQVLPGHGDFTTVGEERQYNPYIR